MLDNPINLEDYAMTMTSEAPTARETAAVPTAPEYGVLDFNAPATIGIVLYESQRTRAVLRDELVMAIGSLRTEMLALDKEARKDTAHQGDLLSGETTALGVALRAEMAAMEKRIRADIRTLLMVTISLHGFTLAAVAAMIKFL